jgi:hypothetical protein
MLRVRIAGSVSGGLTALTGLAGELIVMGTELMDLYLGSLLPREIGAGVLEQLQHENLVALDAYRAWIDANRGYRVVTLSVDDSQWVLRLGEQDDRWLHVHPARWAPKTCRVKANVLKTAVMALAYTGVASGDPMEVELVNKVRRDYLGLAPLGRDLAGDQGIGHTIGLLMNVEGG